MVGTEHMEQNGQAGEVAGKWDCLTWFDPVRQGHDVTAGDTGADEGEQTGTVVEGRYSRTSGHSTRYGREGGQPAAGFTELRDVSCGVGGINHNGLVGCRLGFNLPNQRYDSHMADHMAAVK